MSYRCLRRVAAGILMLCAFRWAGAQDAQAVEVRGTVHSQQPTFLEGYVVEIRDLTPQHQTWRADVNIDGSFVLRNVPRGDYVLCVLNYRGGEIKQELVSVREAAAPVDVYLPREDRAAPGGRVSVRQLQHPPSRKAVEAAAAADKLARAGDTDRAVEQLRKAIRISPDFAAAHSNLGVQYIRERHWAEARAEIERALAIAGPNALDLCNLAFVDAAEGRYGEAMERARAALRADPAYANAHYVLGALLLMDRRTQEEGIRHLERAAEAVPGAREMLARVRRP